MSKRSISFSFSIALTIILLMCGIAFNQLEHSFPGTVKHRLIEWSRDRKQETILTDRFHQPLVPRQSPLSHSSNQTIRLDQYIKYEDIDASLRSIFIASEDAQFFDHHGIKLTSIARAALRNFRTKRIAEGGSTVTQQLVRMALLKQDKRTVRKLVEILLALKLEREMSKQDIFELWFNHVDFGHNIHGIAAASRYYYNCSPNQLSIAQAVTLASLLPAPTRLSSQKFKDELGGRRQRLLERLYSRGTISKTERLAAHSTPAFKTKSKIRFVNDTYPWVKASNRISISNQTSVSSPNPGQKPITPALTTSQSLIQTTIDREIQEAFERATRKLNGTFKGQGLEIAMIAIDTLSGQIRAIVGGMDYSRSQFNRALSMNRPLGSTLSPIIYGLAIDQGIVVGANGEPLGVEAIETKFQEADHLIFNIGPTQVRQFLQPFQLKIPNRDFSMDEIKGSPWSLAQAWRLSLGRPMRIQTQMQQSSGPESSQVSKIQSATIGFQEQTGYILRHWIDDSHINSRRFVQHSTQKHPLFTAQSGWDSWTVYPGHECIYVLWGGVDKKPIHHPALFQKFVVELRQLGEGIVDQFEKTPESVRKTFNKVPQSVSWQAYKKKDGSFIKIPIAIAL